MSAPDRKKTIECDKCGKRIVKTNISRHKKTCMRGSLFCPECPKLTARTKKELDYHIAKKHRKEDLSKKFTNTECMLTFHSFYALRRHKKSLHGSQSQTNVTLSRKVDFDTIMGDHANQQLREKLHNVEHFLVDSESIRGKQHVFNFVLTELSPAVMAEKLRLVFANLENTAKINVSLGFVLRNIESDSYRFIMLTKTHSFAILHKSWVTKKTLTISWQNLPWKISLKEPHESDLTQNGNLLLQQIWLFLLQFWKESH